MRLVYGSRLNSLPVRLSGRYTACRHCCFSRRYLLGPQGSSSSNNGTNSAGRKPNDGRSVLPRSRAAISAARSSSPCGRHSRSRTARSMRRGRRSCSNSSTVVSWRAHHASSGVGGGGQWRRRTLHCGGLRTISAPWHCRRDGSGSSATTLPRSAGLPRTAVAAFIARSRAASPTKLAYGFGSPRTSPSR